MDALNGGPGVYSARYGGEELDDRGRDTLLLQNMRGQTTRAAHFACAIACAFPGGDELTAEGRCDGAIGKDKSEKDSRIFFLFFCLSFNKSHF